MMSIAQIAKAVYEAEWKQRLEAEHRGEFVAIEPTSKTYFLGDTFLAAAQSAKSAFPDRRAFVLRIDHKAAFHIGAS